MKKINYTLSAALSLAIMQNAMASEIETNSAKMQAMDKITGRVNEITVPVKSKISFGDFSLVLRSCKKRPAEETPENFAFVDVADKSFGEEEYNIFRGWIISSTPGINAIEHPIYDVWLLECVDAQVEEANLLSDEELNNRDKLPTKIALSSGKGNKKDDTVSQEKKVIKIKDFISEDRDIEKNIKMPTYISDSSTSYVSEIAEGEEPENLLNFTKMQEDANVKSNNDDDLSKAIDEELKSL
jgi:hypothetical protein